VAAARVRERLCTRAADWAVLGGRSTWALDGRWDPVMTTAEVRRMLRSSRTFLLLGSVTLAFFVVAYLVLITILRLHDLHSLRGAAWVAGLWLLGILAVVVLVRGYCRASRETKS
jgi:hypothetical protein